MEIERKWLVKDFNTDILKELPYYDIKDYYFNETTRLRIQDKQCYITIKSIGTIEREEYNFLIAQCNYDFPYYLEKRRYLYKYKNQPFEINCFKDFILVELELNDKEQIIELPEWIGEEVTNNKQYYGYNLFKAFQYNKLKEE